MLKTMTLASLGGLQIKAVTVSVIKCLNISIYLSYTEQWSVVLRYFSLGGTVKDLSHIDPTW